MKIKVISMKDSDRRESFSKINKHLEFEFVDAIDGSNLSVEIMNDTRLINWENLIYSSGAIGNALSHLALWNEAIDTNKPLTIMEDDLIVRFDFAEKQKFILDNIDPNWDIIYWSYNFDSCLISDILDGATQITIIFNQNLLRESIDKFKNCIDKVSSLKTHMCYGTSGYSISPAGAKKFKETCFPLTHKIWVANILGENVHLANGALDAAMIENFSVLNSYACFPPIAVTKNEHKESTDRKSVV